MFDPTTLATAMSASPRTAAMADVASSGRLVPTAIAVRPMIAGGTPRLAAMSSAF